ncbi:peptide methionine sulfoxide reductase [Parvularcula sp. ZS-1/3]|uniref:peptide-methionine (S)-S-oxide reductase n=1 Tax=Parvularcula mediterranea TaxID=2732508 RepID=A0A7Y3RL43_9PROT|nr:peptide-methionine (S)-S-oxide reductase [Parvularcula mediterranea]NNU16068.1 peptide methionine sulfoxide reductase [Parvularcula mediterranea]
MADLLTLGLGGGCHWCTEAVFQSLRGVSGVEQGFIESAPPHDTASEAVWLQLDEGIMPLSVLLDIHLRTHSSGSQHKMRGKYRSAVYVMDEDTGERCREVIHQLAEEREGPVVTEVLPLRRFILNDARFLNYQKTRPEAPFCKTYIDPKLALLRREFSEFSEEA